MTTTLHAVRGLVPGKRDRTNLRTLSEAMSFCLDQRAQVVIVFCDEPQRQGRALIPRPNGGMWLDTHESIVLVFDLFPIDAGHRC